MTDEQPSEVLGALPRTRPHRRSEKRRTAGPSPEHPDGTDQPTVSGTDAAVDHAAATVPPATDAPGRTPDARRSSSSRGKPASTRGKPSSPQAKSKPSASRTASSSTGNARRAAGKAGARASSRASTSSKAGASARDKGRDGSAAASQTAKASAPPPQDRRTEATSAGVVGTAVQAAAELAEIGLSASARALRNALSRLPRP